MVTIITESEVEELTLEILKKDLKYDILHGPDIAPDGPNPERPSYSEVVLIGRLREAIDRLNLKIPAEAKEEAIKQILRVESPDLVINNHRFHKMLVNGVDVEFREKLKIASPAARNDTKHDKVWLFDFKNPE